ncbi:tyrosine-type recombinase/integrase [Komagataeibacter europaeus]|uniref:tyrosine-type recombinase/integrase n=1 Tax=Komagataeibacter europaeus TaxID=33995 RepID=UPI0015FE0944|nr:tyrosine-type recombinase/integrase [Komagataeibacter europaeus]
MPIKVVSVPKSKNLYLRGTVSGQSIFESTGTSDKRTAEEIRRKREAELWEETVYGKRAVITFAEALASFIADRPQSRATISYYQRILPHLGKKRLHEIDQSVLESLYPLVLRDGNDASPATKKRAIRTPIQAVLEFGAIRKWCDRPAFSSIAIRNAPKKFMRPDEVTRLVQASAPHLRTLLVFLTCTGCRLSEALDLEWKDVDLHGKRVVVWQKQAYERHIDLSPAAYEWMKDLPYRDGHVFRPLIRTRYGMDFGERYHDAGRQYGGQIKTGWAGACRRAGLPGRIREWIPKGRRVPKRVFVPDYTPHTLRHTWASWHYCVHQDILKLKADGAWSEIDTVAGYAKLMPANYREEIIRWWSYGPKIVENP